MMGRGAWTRVEWGLGVGLLVVAAAWGTARQGADPLHQRDSAAQEAGWTEMIEPGTPLDVDGAVRPATVTVVLFTTPSCPVGLVDADFYRHVAAKAVDVNVKDYDFVVVTDDAPDGVRTWLEEHEINVDRIVGSPTVGDLGAVGAPWTPMVVRVDEHGIVTDAVVEAIPPLTERMFLAMLATGGSNGINNVKEPRRTSEQEVLDGAWGDEVRLVDVRERHVYRRGHHVRSINIPADELSVRGRVELVGVEHVVVDCRVGVLGECQDAARTLAMKNGVGEVSVLVR